MPNHIQPSPYNAFLGLKFSFALWFFGIPNCFYVLQAKYTIQNMNSVVEMKLKHLLIKAIYRLPFGIDNTPLVNIIKGYTS